MARGSAGPRRKQTEGQWRRVIRRWEGSGQTISGFCRRQGVSEASFHAWRRRLRSPVTAGRRPGRFVPVQLAGSPGALVLGDTIEIVLGSGRRVRVGSAVASDALRKVLEVLEDRPC
jgi:hypothetical protein